MEEKYNSAKLDLIKDSLFKLLKYIENSNYKGYDPYDALKSPIFKIPFLNSNKIIRLGIQQLVKRFPINIRPLLFVPKGLNPVTLGLCIQGYTYLIRANPVKKKIYVNRIEHLISELKRLIPEGFSGACWGYDFDWEARYMKVPAYQPTVVATGIITNAFFDYYVLTKNKDALDLCKSATNFVLNDLNITTEGNTICFSYSPFDHQQVYNASMKGMHLLSQVYSETNDPVLKETSQKAVEFIVNHQNVDGSWCYSTKQTGKWIDNYHTGYILDCLDEYIKRTNDNTYHNALSKGFNFYKNNFITEHKIPKFYYNKIWPIDCTAASQLILTLIRFNHIDLATDIAIWIIQNMQNKKGYFYFRKYKNYTNKVSFMRWSNAWMFLSLSKLYSILKENKN